MASAASKVLKLIEEQEIEERGTDVQVTRVAPLEVGDRIAEAAEGNQLLEKEPAVLNAFMDFARPPRPERRVEKPAPLWAGHRSGPKTG